MSPLPAKLHEQAEPRICFAQSRSPVYYWDSWPLYGISGLQSPLLAGAIKTSCPLRNDGKCRRLSIAGFLLSLSVLGLYKYSRFTLERRAFRIGRFVLGRSCYLFVSRTRQMPALPILNLRSTSGT